MSLLTTLADAGFHPRALLLDAAVKGAIYAYDDFAYLYQKSDGSTPVTALEQPVGLVVDQRWGGVRGDNKWNTAAASFTGESSQVSSGVYRLYSSAGAYSLVSSTYTVTAGRHYEVSFTVDSVATAGAGIQFESVTGTPIVASTVGAKRVIVLAASTAAIGIKRASTAMDVQISNISVRELPGLHAYQATDAARPVLSARYNLLLATATLSTQSVTTLAASYTLTFTGTGTVTLSGTATGAKSAGSNVFTATAGTLTLTVSGSVTLADLRLTADANPRLPAYQRVTTATDYDSAGFPRFLRIDATDDFLQTASVDPGTDKVFVCAGVTKVSDAAGALLIEFSASTSANNGSFYLAAPITAGTADVRFLSKGTSQAIPTYTNAAVAAPVTMVTSGIGDISGDSAILRVNGAVGATATTDQGTGNYTAQPLYIGARAGTSLRLNNGRIYPMVICFKAVTAGEIAATEAWVNQRTKGF